eukprot:3900576-Pyramimonas_sp.AAC.1
MCGVQRLVLRGWAEAPSVERGSVTTAYGPERGGRKPGEGGPWRPPENRKRTTHSSTREGG